MTTLNQLNLAYASMVYAMDENIGRLLAVLKEKGLYDNTTLIFTSDNGGLSTLDTSFHDAVGPTSVLPLRAGKGWLYEGGIRIPLLIKPAGFRSNNKVCTIPVIGYDFYPTIISMAGIDLEPNQEIDGMDLSQVIKGEENLHRTELYWHYPHCHGSGWKPGAAIRDGDWKLIEFYESDKVELYDLSEDVSEENDLSSRYPERVIALQNRLHALQESMNASRVTFNPDHISNDNNN